MPYATGWAAAWGVATAVATGWAAAWDKATDHLSTRYAMDFRKPARRYAALGTPEQVAESVRKFHAAGVRHLVLDHTGPLDESNTQFQRFATEVKPLLADLL